MHKIVAILIVLLIVLRQDNWLWDDSRLVFGFIPIGLFSQMCISVAAAATWYLAVKTCWPAGLEQDANDSQEGQAT